MIVSFHQYHMMIYTKSIHTISMYTCYVRMYTHYKKHLFFLFKMFLHVHIKLPSHNIAPRAIRKFGVLIFYYSTILVINDSSRNFTYVNIFFLLTCCFFCVCNKKPFLLLLYYCRSNKNSTVMQPTLF